MNFIHSAITMGNESLNIQKSNCTISVKLIFLYNADLFIKIQSGILLQWVLSINSSCRSNFFSMRFYHPPHYEGHLQLELLAYTD